MNSRLFKKICIIALLLVVLWALTLKLLGAVIYFSYYKPSYLPPGISIKQIKVMNIEGSSSVIDLNFRTEDWVYDIEEYRDDNFKLDKTQQNFDPRSVNYTCSTLQSPQHNEYNLCHSIDYGTIGRYEITQTRGHTVLWSAIPTKASRIISQDSINKYVDSFKRVPGLAGPALPSKPGA
jgi:hypothetical protein